MNVNVMISTAKLKSPEKLLKETGLNKKGKIQAKLTNKIAKESEKYIPQGNTKQLKNNKIVSEDSITYLQPYSRYQWYGKVMVGKAPKKVTNKNLHYRHSGNSKWVIKMWRENKEKILKDVERYI